MTTDDAEEAVEKEFAGYHFPLTEDQLVTLQPVLNRIAVKFSRCEADRFDYIAVANLALIDGKRNWLNPVVAAKSAMLDYQKAQAVRGWSDAVTVEGWDVGEDQPDPLVYGELSKFEGLNLRKKDRELAVLYFVEGLTQTEITERTGVQQRAFFVAMNRVKEAVRKGWIGNEDGPTDGGEDE